MAVINGQGLLLLLAADGAHAVLRLKPFFVLSNGQSELATEHASTPCSSLGSCSTCSASHTPGCRPHLMTLGHLTSGPVITTHAALHGMCLRRQDTGVVGMVGPTSTHLGGGDEGVDGRHEIRLTIFTGTGATRRDLGTEIMSFGDWAPGTMVPRPRTTSPSGMLDITGVVVQATHRLTSSGG